MTKKDFLRSDDSGTAAIEFGLVLPMLMLMLVGTVEVARFAVLSQKIDKVVNAMADFVTQGTNVSKSNLTNFAVAVPEIMKPFGFNGTVVFTSVTNVATPVGPCNTVGATCVTWQEKRLGGGSSKIGGAGSSASLPGGYTVASGQDVIVTEVVYNYTPLVPYTGTVITALAPQSLYKVALYKPRQGLLNTIDPN